ncbi:MAG: hypothetical protein GWM88_11900 [Pseudomonadales bacterium]|nr:hypothetical protein [Pseudomonadales bacterium]NIX08660.1 hypothetical protein [Pseudomonadales bacterium]
MLLVSAFLAACGGGGGSRSSESSTQTPQTSDPPPPAPRLSFEASKSVVVSGSTVTLSWTSEDTDQCNGSGDWSGTKSLSGSESVGPVNDDATYVLDCSGEGGAVERAVSVDVAPPTLTLSASESVVTLGAPVTLTWSSTGATSCEASGGWSGTKESTGSETVGPVEADSEYALSCTGPGGTVEQSATVTVAPPTLTLNSSENLIIKDAMVTLTWSTTSATSCQASGSWSGQRDPSGSETVGPVQSESTYALNCTGPGGMVDEEQLVRVASPPKVVMGASSTFIDPGNSVTLNWSATDADACTLSGSWSGERGVTGSELVGPLDDTAQFAVSCNGPFGTSRADVTVVVTGKTLVWQAPTENLDGTPLQDLAGFKVHWGDRSRQYTDSWLIDSPTATSWEPDIAPGTYYFALTAIDEDGTSSWYSNEVVKGVRTAGLPEISIELSETVVDVGAYLTLNWTTRQVESCSASGAWNGARETAGVEIVGPLVADQAFTLTCSGPAGTVTRRVEVDVTAEKDDPILASVAVPGVALSLEASRQLVAEGDRVSISWVASNADACNASGGWDGERPLSGAFESDPLAATSVFALSCSGPGGTVALEVAVEVVPSPSASLLASESLIVAGDSTTLTWSSENASSCEAFGDWSGDLAASGSADTGPLLEDASFGVICSGLLDRAYASVDVQVDRAAKAHWMFDEGAGDVLADANGVSDGQISGAVWGQGASGGALDFNGDADHVALNYTTPLDVDGSAITIAAWILPRDRSLGRDATIIARPNALGDSHLYGLLARDGKLIFRLDGADMTSEATLALGQWQHVIVVYNGAVKRIFVNGVAEATLQEKTDAIDSNAEGAAIGGDADGGSGFNGLIDEVLLFHDAIGADQAQRLYAASVPPLIPPVFEDVSVAAGLSGPDSGSQGAAFADADADGLTDLYLTVGSDPVEAVLQDRFFHNHGGAFVEEALARAIEDADGGSYGAVWADLDNDGDYDLVNASAYTDLGEAGGVAANNNVYQNDGTGSFADITAGDVADIANARRSRGVTAHDADGDHDLDLLSIPLAADAGSNEAYLNDGAMNFSANPNAVLGTTPASRGLIDTDFDGDRDVDIIAANSPGAFAIFRNDGGGTFVSVAPADLGIQDDAGDGISAADVDVDDDLDLLLVSDGSAHLYLRQPSGQYLKQQSFQGRDGYMGGFADIDNDGDEDLIFAGDSVVYLNDGGGAFRPGPSIPMAGISDPRAIAFGDIDNDGDLDFVVTDDGGESRLIRNDLAQGNWLKVDLRSPQGQAGAFGARVLVYPEAGTAGPPIAIRESRGNHGYLAQDDPVLHFGLGSVDVVDVVVRFADGSETTLAGVAANQVLLVRP